MTAWTADTAHTVRFVGTVTTLFCEIAPHLNSKIQN